MTTLRMALLAVLLAASCLAARPADVSAGDLDAFAATIDAEPNRVCLNDGAASFTDSGQALSGHSLDVALGDVDGDGDLDAFTANQFAPQGNKVWLNDGSGTFTDSGQSLGSLRSIGVKLGDLDGDGDLDAFVANHSGSSPNKVWLNDGTGTFADSGQSLGSAASYGVALGDLDGDGDLDAFVANLLSSEPNRVWRNDGTANFSVAQSLGNTASFDVALGDLDGDGDLDAFVANDDPNEVWLNDGSATFTDSGQRLGGSNVNDNGVALGDLDGDGDLDAFVARGSDPGGVSFANTVWLNDGSGTFTDSGQSLGSAGSYAVALGDLDGDGDLDAFVANLRDTEPNRVWLNDGSATFPTGLDVPCGDKTFGVALGDLDGDDPAPDHILLYAARVAKGTPGFARTDVTLADQFNEPGRSRVFVVEKPVRLGNPADKQGEGIADPDTHYVGYRIRRAPGQARHVRLSGILVANQFGEVRLDTGAPDRLLVPSAKDLADPVPPLPPLPPGANHFKCYTVKVTRGTPRFERRDVSVADQFNQPALLTVRRPTRLCNPVDKNGEGIIDPATHLLCYMVKRAADAPAFAKVAGIHVANQLGALQLDARKESELCVPSAKDATAAIPLPGDDDDEDDDSDDDNGDDDNGDDDRGDDDGDDDD